MACRWQFSAILLLSVLVAFVVGQIVDEGGARLQQLQANLPACALACTADEVPKSSCQPTDLSCICSNQELNNAILLCLARDCTVIEQLQTQKAVSTACDVPVRNTGKQLVFATWPLYAVAVVMVFIRLAGRLQIFGGHDSWDDYVMIVCLFNLTALAGMAQVLVNTGEGRDIWMLSPQQIQDTLFYFWIGQFLYCSLAALTKISILLLYLRIFTTKAFKWQCWTLITITALYGTAAIIATGCLCNPIDWVWKGWDGQHPAKCVNINALTWAVAAINMALDICIIVLPLYQVNMRMYKTQAAFTDSLKLWNLQMHTKKKLAVGSMFMVGLFVTICSGIRLRTIMKFQRTSNPTYDYTQLSVWSLIESSAGVICACMPGLANAIRRFWPKFLTTYSQTKSRHLSTTNGGLHTLNSNSEYAASRKIRSKTTVSITYAEHPPMPDSRSARSDELELTPPTAYKQHESHTRYSEDSSSEDREDRKYGYRG